MSITGKGDYPLASAWLRARRGNGRFNLLYRTSASAESEVAAVTDWFFESGAATVSISGSAAVTFTAIGTLAGKGALSGSISVTFSTAGSLTGRAALSGSTTVAFTATGTLSGGPVVVEQPRHETGATNLFGDGGSRARRRRRRRDALVLLLAA